MDDSYSPPPTSTLIGAMQNAAFLEEIAYWANRDEWLDDEVEARLRRAGIETSVPTTRARVRELRDSIEDLAPRADAALAELSDVFELVGGLRGTIAEICARPAQLEQADQLVDALKEWADAHGGLAPRQDDWSAAADPDGAWPRATFVIRVFRDEAAGTTLTPWTYALSRAGLSVRTAGDGRARNAVRLGRNRQMVTGGVVDQRSQIFTA